MTSRRRSSSKPSTSHAPSRAVSTSPEPPRPKKRRKKNGGPDDSTYPGCLDPEKLQQDFLQNSEVASLPQSVQRNLLSIRKIWLKHFTDVLGSEKKALATLQPNGALPRFDSFKAFVCALGRWGVGTFGWSYLSMRVNATFVLNMLELCRGQNTTDTYQRSINAAMEFLRRKTPKDKLTHISQFPPIQCFTTCYFCGVCVFNDENASIHFEECYTSAIAQIFEKMKADPLLIGFISLSHTVPAGVGGFKVTNTFCPLCLFDKTLSWEQRMVPQPNPTAMAQHIVSHTQEDGEFRMDKMLYCGFFPWDADGRNTNNNWLPVPDMFTHLHNDHGYRLLACTDPFHYLCTLHKTRDLLFERRDLRKGGVSNTIFYAADIRHIRELLGHDADEFGTICLADRCRTAEAKARGLAALNRMYEEQDPDR